ncbi:Ubx2p KNAG_0B03600 [Huiozyma naganishii CBS 8797]|uniref:UBX domain-containing protein n=1 Tax=Huiozyma naganishii (strain ATCC MYA-139 / BCRC 22969 / CBS 8797 / KCTC 17520 / NBRC 10181 / NCYC 3082 / Yp74L-3) TaxID=1071383 RepID=J7RV70_HUIN7|nr:hypothetical protein KNAG_0B03600 [Kazachstania naganishii CBS 8797]CCK68802.1 hypothetical protein KNAG_0B03600 [Kazachstania naganishii CBS 8797]
MPVISHRGEEFHLAHDEEDKLNQFQSITSFTEDDLPLIVKLLRNHGWQLEPALSRYFDGDWRENLSLTETPAAPPMRSPSPSPPTQPQQRRGSIESGSPTPRISRSVSATDNLAGFDTSMLVPTLPVVHSLPANYKDRFQLVGLNRARELTQQPNPLMIILLFIPNTLLKLVSLLWSLLSKLHIGSTNVQKPKIFRVPKQATTESNEVRVGELIEDEDLAHRLEGVLGERPAFNDALQSCKEEFKYMLVLLVGNVRQPPPTEDAEVVDEKAETVAAVEEVDSNSMKFLRNVVCDNGTLKLLEDYKDEMIVYLGSVIELEPWLITRDLKIKYTPEAFLIGNVLNSNGSVNGATKLSVLSKLRVTSARRFQNSLKLTLDKFNPEMTVNRTEHHELRTARKIRQMQEEAYQNSLMEDKMKAERRKIKEQEEALEQQLLAKRESEAKMAETLRQLQWLEKCIDVMETHGEGQQKADTGKYATLQIRTSEGTRFVCKFVGDTTLHSVYINVGCHLYLNNNSPDQEAWAKSVIAKIKELMRSDSVLCFKDIESAEDDLDDLDIAKLIREELAKHTDGAQTPAEISFDFELVSPFPRYKVPTNEKLKLREVSQLWPNGSLLVENIIEEDDEGEEGTTDDSE